MKKKAKKVLLSILAATTIMTVTLTIPAHAGNITVNMPRIIYESKKVDHLSSGVTHENIRKFTTLGWWNINVIRIDMEDEYTELKGIFNEEGIHKRDKVSSMVDKHNAVAAVNGDYFNYSPLPSSMGTLINDGEVISSPIELAYALPSFYLTESNVGNVGYLDRNIVVSNTTNQKRLIVNTLNKVDKELTTLTLLNKHWGAQSIGNRFHKDLVEVVVENNIVKDVRTGQEAVTIPKENGYVIAGRGRAAEGLLEFNKGDQVDLTVETTPSADAIKFAIGGGSIILKNGELSLTNINSTGLQPRTGIGVNKDNTEMILVTIDGRDTSFKGVSQETFGALMKELGAYHALNLDGGGSTAMAIKPAGDEKSQVVNKPSEGQERPVVNSVGVFSNAPKGELAYLKISASEPVLFVDTTRNLEIKGYDKHHNPIEIDKSLVEFSVEGVEGSFTGNKFKPTTMGTAHIKAIYNGKQEIKGDTELKVLGTIKDISTDVNSFSVKPNSQHKLPAFYGKDKNGISARIYLEDMNFEVIGNIGTIKDGIFHSNDNPEGGAITARAGEGLKNILVSTGLTGTIVDSFESIENYSFSSYPATVTGNIGLNQNAKDGKNSLAIKYDFSQGTDTRAAYLNLHPQNGGFKLANRPEKLGLWVKGDNSGSWLRASLKDANGKEHLLSFTQAMDWTDWKFVEASIPDNIAYPVTLQKIYVVETDSLRKQSGEILIDGLTAYYPKNVSNIELPTPTKFVDDMNKKSEVSENGFTFVVGHDPKDINKIAGYDASSAIKSEFNKHKIAVSLNGFSDGFKSGLNNYAYIGAPNDYRTSKHLDAFFISLNSTKGGIRPTNAEQWIKLNNDLNTRTESNIILFLPTPIFGSNGFTDQLEADLFHDTLKSVKEKDKNIFVIHGGSSNSTELKDGVRYIGLDTRDIKSPEQMKNLSLVNFVVNGDSISYEINKVFK